MSISCQCPSCQRIYKLKDELHGKRVTCANKECRNIFIVGSAETEVKKQSSQEKILAAEELAARLFSEEAESSLATASPDQKFDHTCIYCDHVWAISVSMRGKNVLCPECRERQKIPELVEKKIDWRDPNARRPTLAKGEELPEDLKQQQAKNISIGALKQAGAIPEPEYEPRPLKQKIMFVALILGFLGTVSVGGWYFFSSRDAQANDQLMVEAVAKIEQLPEEGVLPKGQQPLFKALIHIQAAEYFVRLNSLENLEKSLGHVASARQLLEEAPRSSSRNILLGELALVTVQLGGTEDQVKAQTRIRFTPLEIRNNRPQLGELKFDIRNELTRIFRALQSPGKQAPFLMRVDLCRKLATELTPKGQFELLPSILSQAFTEEEQPEALSQILLASLDAGAEMTQVHLLAETLKTVLEAKSTTASPAPISAALLWKRVTPAIQGPVVSGAPPTSGNVGRASRLGTIQLLLLQGKDEEAIKLASRPGPIADQLSAWLLLAEKPETRKQALERAAEYLSKIPENQMQREGVPPFTLFQLCLLGAQEGTKEKLQTLIALINDADLKQWATAGSMIQQPLQETGMIDLQQFTLPSDAESHVSFAWACQKIARHNGKIGATEEAFTGWSEQVFRPFGWSGIALGLQDRQPGS